MLYAILLLVHIIICVLVFLAIKFNILKVHDYMFFVVLLLPFWGLLLVLILHFQIFFEADNAIDIDVEKMKLGSELYRSVTIDENNMSSRVVPIEEALVVNTARERRTIIMDVLNDNPKDYIEFLQKAGNNDDTEVVHYAVTAMVEISKENDHTLQKFEKNYSADPDNFELLCQYIDFLWVCLCQNLMTGQVEVLNRELFSSLIQKKISIKAEIADFTKAIENELLRKNYTLASQHLQIMADSFADTEEYYLSKLNYLASLERGDDIKTLINELESKQIFLSAKAKETLAFWKE